MIHRLFILLVAVLLLFAGASSIASAQGLSNDAPRGNWDTTESTGEIILDGSSAYSVFQGERDIDGWRNVGGEDVTGEFLERSSGGDILDLESSISRNQSTGRYSSPDGNLSARVRSPSVTSVDFFNSNGVRLRSGATVRRTDKILVRAEWNFVEAEDLQIEIREPDGTTVTREALTREVSNAQQSLLPSGFSNSFLSREIQGTGSTGYSTAYWLIDPSELSSGNNRIRVEGVEDLNFGSARATTNLRVGSEARPTLRLSQSEATQGERVGFEVGGGEPGQYHAVGVRRGELRADVDPQDVFRLVGETVETGNTSDHAYAVVEVTSRGSAMGQIEARTLRTGSRDVRMFESGGSIQDAKDSMSQGRQADSRSLEVQEGELSMNIAGGTYVTGQRIDISGTASSGVRNVVVYVRDREDWEILPLNGRDTTSVSNGRWTARGVVLSKEDYGGQNFQFPGTYSIAVVDASDLESPPPRTITPSDFNRLTSSRSSVRATAPTFVGNFGLFSGQVAEGDRIGFTGTSTGANEIVVVFVGDRDVRAQVIRETRGSFVNRQIDLDGMRRGDVTAFAISPGRDGTFGQGSATDSDGNSVSINSPEDFRDFVMSFDRDGRTRAQRIARIRSASVEPASSDDLMRSTAFRIVDARTTVRDVVPASQPQLSGVLPILQDESFIIRGTTNRNPEDTEIDVEITDGPDSAEFDTRTVEDWSNAGTWSASFSASGVSTGSYTVEVDDGSSTDTVTFSVVSQRTDEQLSEAERLAEEVERLRREAERLRNETDEARDEAEELEEENQRLRDEADSGENETMDDDSGNETEDEQTPGFTAIASVIALLAVVVVATRRRKG